MNRKTFIQLLLFVLSACLSSHALASDDDKLLLWFQQPAKIPMNEALAIGNGHMGGMVFGEPAREHICIN